jgi:fluoride exporter
VTLLLVMLGAAAGAPSRWLLDQAIQSRHDRVFPLGTMTINATGSLLLGVLLAAASLGRIGHEVVALLGTGFCGGYTTFSTFGYETVRLVEEGSLLDATLNVLVSVALGMAAALAGWYATTWLLG